MSERDFERDVAPLRAELLAHCYRMTGATSDAEDALQEALVRAWRAYASFEGRSSRRTWLYRIATNACLDLLADRRARTLPETGAAGDDPAWLEPFAGAVDDTRSPDAIYSSREAVRLAFVVALQVLPPRQRAVLILRDVVGLSAEESAEALDTSVAGITSALQRARETLADRPLRQPPADPSQLRTLLERYLAAWEAGDAGRLIALLRSDAIVSMPPHPLWARGAQAVADMIAQIVFPLGPQRLVACEANGGPAFAVYLHGKLAAVSVLDISGDRVAAIHSFLGDAFAGFALAPRYPQ